MNADNRTELPKRSPSKIASELLDLANDMETTIAEQRKAFPVYGDQRSVPYIIDFQLSRRNVGEEPRLLREAAAALAGQANGPILPDDVELLKRASQVPYLLDNYRNTSDEIDEIACELEAATALEALGGRENPQ